MLCNPEARDRTALSPGPVQLVPWFADLGMGVIAPQQPPDPPQLLGFLTAFFFLPKGCASRGCTCPLPAVPSPDPPSPRAEEPAPQSAQRPPHQPWLRGALDCVPGRVVQASAVWCWTWCTCCLRNHSSRWGPTRPRGVSAVLAELPQEGGSPGPGPGSSGARGPHCRISRVRLYSPSSSAGSSPVVTLESRLTLPAGHQGGWAQPWPGCVA